VTAAVTPGRDAASKGPRSDERDPTNEESLSVTRTARAIADSPTSRPTGRSARSLRPRPPAVEAIAADPVREGLQDLDWAAARAGAREVFVTLMGTLALGLGWAAVEAGRLNAALAEADRARTVAADRFPASPAPQSDSPSAPSTRALMPTPADSTPEPSDPPVPDVEGRRESRYALAAASWR